MVAPDGVAASPTATLPPPTADAAGSAPEPMNTAAGGGELAPARGPAAGEAIAADLLRQYRLDLASAARRYRAYPAIARARGWEGTVELALAFSGGSSPVISVGRSSGYAVLDAQAEETLTRAALATPVPEPLRGRSMTLTIPIRFSLED